ncbi:leucine rich adaptor protein 1 [Sylvia atricapilla]|uniref:leucine rich adaptor protein 1 n=1 Tax=Sylvia atricapilla TaxID=48155 RepID=UPI003390F53E
MEGGGEALPADLRDLAGKVGRRPPAVLLRGLRADTAPAPPAPPAPPATPAPARGAHPPLAERLRTLRLELAYLRAVDVKILQQLVVVNEGIEAVKWLLEERSTLTSRCSSLASSQYSLVESQEASRRGSWDSLQDPNDRLDSISVGSYLDTLADDMDEYSHNAAETAAASTSGRALARAEQDWVRIDPERGLAKQEKDKEEHEWPHVDLSPPGLPQDRWFAKEPQVANGYLGQQCPSLEPDRDTKSPPRAGERLGKGNPDGKAWKAETDLENCKLNTKLHLEYDAHWRWLQSQDDVTFL